MCDITGGLNAYAGLNADVIAISIDAPFAQEAWAQKEKIGITLASDLNKEVIKQYDVVFPMLAGVGDTAARAAFVIDKTGVVQYSEQTPTPKDLPNFDQGQSHARETEVGASASSCFHSRGSCEAPLLSDCCNQPAVSGVSSLRRCFNPLFQGLRREPFR